MLKFAIVLVVILHGMVHLMYFCQSQRIFELKTGMVWPDGSWAFRRLLGDSPTRSLASLSCLLAGILFVGGGLALLLGQTWWRPLIVGAAGVSVALYILFWDGKLQKLDAQGVIGLLISAAILASLLILRWPSSASLGWS